MVSSRDLILTRRQSPLNLLGLRLWLALGLDVLENADPGLGLIEFNKVTDNTLFEALAIGFKTRSQVKARKPKKVK